MADSPTIARKPSVPDPFGFDALKKEGTDLLQDLSGKVWTDYNVHDPGVTILEQLCYALTDLIYRADLDVVDYLADTTGKIAYSDLALYLPHEILPSQPITADDYRKSLADRDIISGNVWIHPSDAGPPGVYTVDISSQLPEGVSENELRETVWKTYCANRNLGEDLRFDDIRFTPPRTYTLHGIIEAKGERDHEGLLAEIYVACAQFVAPGIRFDTPEEAIAKGVDRETVLTGPATTRGYAKLDDRGRNTVSVSDLIGVIREITDVADVENLWIEGGETLYEADVKDWQQAVEDLTGSGSPVRTIKSKLPEGAASALDRLREGSTTALTDDRRRVVEGLDEAMRREDFYDEEAFAGVPLSRDATELRSQIQTRPNEGDTRAFNRLVLESVVNGIAKSRAEIPYDPGLSYHPVLELPHTADEVGLGLLKSERVYTILFSDLRTEFEKRRPEQRSAARPEVPSSRPPIPAGERITGLSSYHSIQNHFPATYGINRQGVPAAEGAERQTQAKQLKAYLLLFDQIMADFQENLVRIPSLFSLDEQLDRTYFHQALTDREVPRVDDLYVEELQVSEAASAAGAGPDWLDKAWKPYDPFFDRRSRVLDYLLSLYGERFSQNSLRKHNPYDDADALSDRILRNKIRLLRNLPVISRERAKGFDYLQASWNTENVSGLQKRVSILLDMTYTQARSPVESITSGAGLQLTETPPEQLFEQVDLQDDSYADLPRLPRRDPSETEPGNPGGAAFDGGALSESLLRRGVEIDRYRLLPQGDDASRVVFRADSETWSYLTDALLKEDAIQYGNRLRRYLIALNRDAESLHLVEHILLRSPKASDRNTDIPEIFYPHRISIIFPGWTARCSDSGFRLLAEETVRLNCPAQIAPDFYWLPFDRMGAFEKQFKCWLENKADTTQTSAGIQAAADDLARTLLGFASDRAESDGDDTA